MPVDSPWSSRKSSGLRWPGSCLCPCSASLITWLLLVALDSKSVSSCRLFCISERLKVKRGWYFPHFLWGYMFKKLNAPFPLMSHCEGFSYMLSCSSRKRQDMKILASTERYLGWWPTVLVCPGLTVVFLGCWTFSLKLESFQIRGKNQSLRRWL